MFRVQAEKEKGVRLTISVRQATRHDWPALQRLFLLSRCHTFTWLNVTDFRLTDLEKQTEGETIWLAHDPQGELAGLLPSGCQTTLFTICMSLPPVRDAEWAKCCCRHYPAGKSTAIGSSA
jgi:hypothetical protein